MGSGIDEDVLIAFACGLLAVACAVLAVRGFRRGSLIAGIVWSVGTLAFGFVAWFFATFTMRMF
jgi:lipopolysaccharide export LptBFGC system permease protein LptF